MNFLSEAGQHRDDLLARRKVAEDQLPTWTQAAARRRAKFSTDPGVDAAKAAATFQKLVETPSSELIEHLRDAVREKDFALAEAVRLVFTKRHENQHSESLLQQKESIRVLLSDLVDDNSVAQTKTCQAVIALADLGEVEITQVVRGKSDPIGRMNAARGLGMSGDFTTEATIPIDGDKLEPVDKINAARGVA